MFDSALTLDIPFARKVLEHLRAHPDEHEQQHFAVKTPCGTVACIAGTAVLLDPDSKPGWDRRVMTSVRVDGKQLGVVQRARQLFGLDRVDAEILFYLCGNDAALDRLENYIKAAEAAQSFRP